MHDTPRILTVRQPHAQQIVTGRKTIEHRSWSTPYRGLVLIHAGLTADEGGVHLPRGVIVGHVQLADIRPTFGGWDWLLTEPVLLTSPVPHRGGQGLRPVPGHLLADLAEV